MRSFSQLAPGLGSIILESQRLPDFFERFLARRSALRFPGRCVGSLPRSVQALLGRHVLGRGLAAEGAEFLAQAPEVDEGFGRDLLGHTLSYPKRAKVRCLKWKARGRKTSRSAAGVSDHTGVPRTFTGSRTP